ncbi:MAG TPA: hypothetical protein ENI80_03600 [Acidiferrobacteraceae bacterium]|nr:hypothetical protein [Acidiferrobacteraceae bacterium]
MGLPNIQYTGDNIVIRTVNGEYRDTLANFAVDYGKPAPSVPDTFLGVYYEPGVKYHKSASSRSDPMGSLTWKEGDDIIAAADAIIAAQVSRLNPPATLDDIKTAKQGELIFACRTTITGGFTSAALGAVHTYPLSESDQTNMQAVYSSAIGHAGEVGWSGLIQCQAVGESAPTYKIHDETQVRAVGDAAIAHKDQQLQKLGAKIAEVEAAYAANDSVTLAAVAWL